MPVSPLVVASLLSGLLCVVSGWLVRGRWSKPGAGWFQVGAASSAIWAVSYGLGLLVFDPDLRWLFEVPIWLGHGVAPVAFFLFVAAYTGRRAILDRPVVVGLFVVPAITFLAVATSTEHSLLWTGYAVDPAFGAATVSYEKEPWLYVHKAYSYAVLLAAGAILVEVLIDREAIYTVQAVGLLGVVVSLGAGSVVWVLGIGPYPQVTTTPLLFGVVFTVAALVFFRAPQFDSPPAARRLGRERLLAEFGDGVVVVDDEGRIVEVNDSAVDLLGADAEGSLLGSRLSALDVGTDGSIPTEEGRHTISLATASGHQPFEVTVSTIRDDSGTPLGRTLLFQDVSEATRRRQQLSVLNRVLRHNLRNDMTVVRAYGEQLAAETEEPLAGQAETIVEEADGLLSLGEQARTIEEALVDPEEGAYPVDLPELIDEIVDPYRDRAAVTVDVPDDAQLVTNSRSLSAMLTAAVDNAVAHADSERPTVEVVVEQSGDWTTIEVRDDGPGIPDHELEPIDSGTETDLEHGSGLGLWLITWAAGSLGGEVSFRTGEGAGMGEDGGTSVTVRLPNGEPPVE